MADKTEAVSPRWRQAAADAVVERLLDKAGASEAALLGGRGRLTIPWPPERRYKDAPGAWHPAPAWRRLPGTPGTAPATAAGPSTTTAACAGSSRTASERLRGPSALEDFAARPTHIVDAVLRPLVIHRAERSAGHLAEYVLRLCR